MPADKADEKHPSVEISSLESQDGPAHHMSSSTLAGDDQSDSLQTQLAQSTLKGDDTKKFVRVMLIVCIMSAPVLYGMDLIFVANAQLKIVEDFGEIYKLPWVSTASLLAAICTLLLWGNLYTYYNIKWIFLSSIVWFDVGCALCGAATSMDMLIVGRAVGGVGRVGLWLGAMLGIAAVTTVQQRPLYYSYFLTVFGVSSILTPLISGGFSDSRATWRWNFYLMMCITAVFAPGYLLLFPSKTFNTAPMTLGQRFRALDGLGNMLWAGACATSLTAISFGGTILAWNSYQTIILFVVSGASFCGFVLQQWKQSGTSGSKALFPAQLLRSMEMCNLFLQQFLSAVTGFGPVYLIPIHFQVIHNASVLSAGVYLLPLLISRCVCTVASGFLMAKSGLTMPFYVAGSAITLVGAAPFLVATPSTPTANFYGYSLLLGIGTGLYMQSPPSVAQARVGPALAPQATTFIMTSLFLGLSFSLATINTIFLNRVSSLARNINPDWALYALPGALPPASRSTMAADLPPDQKARILDAVSKALVDAWVVVVVAAAGSFIFALVMKRDRLWR